MEMWLTYEEERLRMPVTPLFEIEHTYTNSQEVLNEFGTVNIKGKKGLRTVSIESHFPAQKHEYVDFSDVNLDPYYYVQKLKSWAEADKPIRLIFTETPFNFEVLIDSFKPGEVDGSSDVYYSLSMSEYVQVKKKEYKIPIQERTVRQWVKFVDDAKKETGVKTDQELYDTPWAKAKALTGEGENYKILDEAMKQLLQNKDEVAKIREEQLNAVSKNTNAVNTSNGKKIIVEATAYTPSPRENGGHNTTARGNPLTPYKYIAVDPKVIPYGTKVYIPEFKDTKYGGIFIADDCGGAIKGKKIDVLLPNTKTANAFGRKKNYEIYIVK